MKRLNKYIWLIIIILICIVKIYFTSVQDVNANISLTSITIPATVTEMQHSIFATDGTFYGCTGLTQAPKIPDGVTGMYYTFYDCTSLEQAPEIPSRVTQMTYAFEGCSKLTGNLIINAENLLFYHNCLRDAATEPGCKLVLSGSCPKLQEIYDEVKDNPNITLAQ